MAQYTDAEMLLAAQIAYMDIEPGQNVAEAIDATLNAYKDSPFGSREWWQYQWAESAQKIIDQNGLESYQNWTIADVCNREIGSGFYGCLIDDGSGNAIIGCRGSEQYDMGQIINDWGEADLGLLNSVLTEQQADATAYMQYIYDNYGDTYGCFGIAGHSLGGNLAEHSAVTAPEGMRDMIDCAINFDGPGFSDEYIEAHMDDIRDMSDKIDHYQYSVVGSLLTPLPGVGRDVIAAHDDSRLPGVFGQLLRHDARNVIFDDDGNVQPGDPDWLQNTFGPITRFIDGIKLDSLNNIPFVGPALYDFARDIGERGKEIADYIANLYDTYCVYHVSGEYEVNLAGLRTFPDELESIAFRSEDIADEVRSIVSSLKYHSVSGAYYKNKLRRIARNIEKAGRYARKSGNTLSDAISLYALEDRDVAASYT